MGNRLQKRALVSASAKEFMGVVERILVVQQIANALLRQDATLPAVDKQACANVAANASSAL